MPKRYSNFFEVPAKVFEEHGIFNAFVDQDTRFHVDPLLLRGCTIPEFQGAYDKFLEYFRYFRAFFYESDELIYRCFAFNPLSAFDYRLAVHVLPAAFRKIYFP